MYNIIILFNWGQSSHEIASRLDRLETYKFNILRLWNRTWAMSLIIDELFLSELKSFNSVVFDSLRWG